MPAQDVDWANVIETIKQWRGPAEKAAEALREPTRLFFPTAPVGFYVNPVTQKLAFYASSRDDIPAATEIVRAVGDAESIPTLTAEELAREPWVKVAHSELIRQVGENLNFLPGQFAGTIPNFASPLAATLTSGLVGAGLGYGGGWLAKQVLPEEYGENLPRTGMILGGLAGAAPGAAWMAHKAVHGESVLDPGPFTTMDSPRHNTPPLTNNEFIGLPDVPKPAEPFHEGMPKPWLEFPERKPAPVKPRGGAKNFFNLSSAAPMGHEPKFASSFADLPPPTEPTPFDVHIDSMGRTLWQSDAPQPLASAALSTLYAASQMPSPRQVPGYVTGEQFGNLAMNLAGDYATGYAAGKALNLLVGTPHSAPTFGVGAATVGLIGAVLPKIFGG